MRHRVAGVPRRRFDMMLFRRRFMRTLHLCAFLTSLAVVACCGLSGCSTEPASDTGKMAGPMDKMDTGKMAGPMDKMDTGKMAGPTDKMDTGKMAGPMDKMDTGKMAGPTDKMNTGKMAPEKQ
jgi:uncharacterized protein involved in copper resistance